MYFQRQIVYYGRHIVVITETYIIQLDSSRKTFDNAFSLGDFRKRVKYGFYHFVNRLDICNSQSYACQRHERSGYHSVCNAESVIIGYADTASYRKIIHRNRSRQRYGRSYNGIKLQKCRRIIIQTRHHGIMISPFCKSPLFRPRKLYLLYSRYKSICKSALFSPQLHLFPAYAQLYERRDHRNRNGRKYHQKRRYYQSRSISKYLSYIYQRKYRRQSRGKHRRNKHIAKRLHAVRSRGKVSGTVFLEKISRKR